MNDSIYNDDNQTGMKMVETKTNEKLEIWGRAQREAARGVRKEALMNF